MPHGRRKWTPVAVHVGPSADALYRTGQNQLLLIRAAMEPNIGMDPRNESIGSEVWKRYGIGSMNQARSGTGINSIL